MTLPDGRLKIDWYLKRKGAVNNSIREYAATDPSRIAVVDLFSAIPFTEPGNGSVWDDNLHFNEAGYDRMADLIFAALNDAKFWPPTSTK